MSRFRERLREPRREQTDSRVPALDLDFKRRVNRLLVEALELPAERRHDHVVAQAGEDRELASEVLALLAGQAELGAFLEAPAVVDLRYVEAALSEASVEDDDGPLPPAPESIGPYAIVERLGAGGMGEVFRARQEEPVRREVALKRLHTHLDVQARERFVLEQQALALLGHSNVARLYDVGTTADGRPYFAMELVAGLPITEYCDAHELPVAERLRIFLQVAAGVEHAHRHQILHRDLKPSNVLVVEESGRAVPKVIDFGLAKSLDPLASGDTMDTVHGLLGTPAYMSPEAIAPETVEGGIDTRADVYSLGVLLFELLTGRTPFGEDSGLVALLGRLEGGTADTPSRSLERLEETESGAVAGRRGATRRELLRTVGGDLDWIVSKAMAPERERRYGSVGELAADVRRHLAHQPVEARPPSTAYRLRKLARRHRTAAVAAVVALVGILLGIFGLGFGLLRARREAAAARQSLAESREVSSFLVGLFDASRPGSKPPNEISAQDLLDRGVKDLATRLTDQPAARGRFLRTIGDVYVQMGRYDEADSILAESERLLRSALPADSPEISAVVRSRAVLAFHRSQWHQAEELFRAGLRGLDPAADPKTWELAVHNLGVALLEEGRLDEARAELDRALAVQKRYLPPDHPHLARSYNALGTLALKEGDPEEAAADFERAVSLLERTLGPSHAYVALALNNLAVADRRLDRRDEADSALTRAIAIQEKALGPNDPELADPLLSLGRALRSDGKPEKAEPLLERALELRRAALGDDNPRVAVIMRSLGMVELDLGRQDKAERLLTRSLAIGKKAGWSSSSLEYCRMYLGLIALARGHLDQAEKALEQSLAVWRKAQGPESPSVSWPLLGLARIHRARGDLAGAEKLARQALEIREKAYPGDSPWVREARDQLDQILREERGAKS